MKLDKLVYTADESNEFETAERCSILEIYNTSSDRNQSIARARVLPGITTSWHRLKDTTELYYILQGSGTMEIGEEVFKEVKKGDIIKIPPNTAQRITNTSDEDLLFLCFCTPAFSDANYISLE